MPKGSTELTQHKWPKEGPSPGLLLENAAPRAESAAGASEAGMGRWAGSAPWTGQLSFLTKVDTLGEALLAQTVLCPECPLVM